MSNFVEFSYFKVLKELWVAGKKIIDAESEKTTLPGPLSWGGGAEIASSDLIAGGESISADLSQKADKTHTHDDRYYTESEIKAGFNLRVTREDDSTRKIYPRTFPLWKADNAVAHLIIGGNLAIDFEQADGTELNLALGI